MAEAKKFTLAQVKEHNNGKDLWIVIRDKVYNVTKFLSEVSQTNILLSIALCSCKFHLNFLIYLLNSIQVVKMCSLM